MKFSFLPGAVFRPRPVNGHQRVSMYRGTEEMIPQRSRYVEVEMDGHL